MSKSLLDILLDQIFDDEWKGKRGEKLTEKELKLVQLFGRKGKILRNIYLPKEKDGTSEVDVVFITQKGIFVFESKNYSGWIFGDERSQYWTAMLPNKEKNRFYNPVKQNRTHLKWMQQFVGEGIPLFSIIVFSERCELKKIQLESNDIKVIKRDRTYATVRDIWDHNPDTISEEDVEKLYEKLKVLTNVAEAVKAAHVENIKNRFEQQTENKAVVIKNEVNDVHDTENVTSDMICPRCGSKMIIRTAKKGANAGNQFYGCSNFPKCRYIKNL